jgi:hypothetical protein
MNAPLTFMSAILQPQIEYRWDENRALSRGCEFAIHGLRFMIKSELTATAE